MSNTAKIRRVDRPREEPILVALERLQKCPPDLAGDYWPPDKRRGGERKRKSAIDVAEAAPGPVEVNSSITDVQREQRSVSTPQLLTGTDAPEEAEEEPAISVQVLQSPLIPLRRLLWQGLLLTHRMEQK